MRVIYLKKGNSADRNFENTCSINMQNVIILWKSIIDGPSHYSKRVCPFLIAMQTDSATQKVNIVN